MSYINQQILGGGVSNAGVLLQTSGNVGGKRHVFVGLVGDHGFVKPTIGGYLVNPFKGAAKAFAGDLCEYDPTTSQVKLLKTYEAAAAAATTTVTIKRDGFRHRPLVGDILMVAPATLNATGTGVTVTAVKVSDDGATWILTTSAATGAKAGDILIEATAAGADAKPVVTNPNALLPCDMDFFYNPNDVDDGNDEYYKVRYAFTPALAGQGVKMYTDRMSPMPAAVKALNKSMWNGWFEL